MTDDLDELERLARAATPGPWEDDNSVVKTERGTICYAHHSYEEEGWQAENNASLIAAANPATILSLIHRVREAEDRADKSDMRAFGAINLLPGDMPLASVRGAAHDMAITMIDRYNAGLAAGRAETLEEAAKVAEGAPHPYGASNPYVSEMREAVAQAIRKLGEKAG